MKHTLVIMNLVGVIWALNACKEPQNKTDISNQKSSLLWRISGNGLTSESYLYGTIHIQDKRVFEFGDTVKKCFDDSNIIAVEVELDVVDPRTLFSVTFMKDSILTQLVTPEEYKFLETKYKELTGVSLKTANNVKPFFISANIIQSLVNKDTPEPLDLYFIKQARQKNKRIIGLETLEEQIGLIDEMSYTEQVKILIETLGENNIQESFNKLLNAYLEMNDSLLMELTTDPTIPKDFMEKLLKGRNKLMVSRLIPLITEEKVFAAVGAAHLFGDDGIVELLRKKGYEVTPVSFRFGKK